MSSLMVFFLGILPQMLKIQDFVLFLIPVGFLCQVNKSASFFSSFLLVFFHINFDVQLSSLRWKHFKIFLPFLASPRSHWFQFLQSNFLLVSCLRCAHFCLIMSASPGDEHVSLYRNGGRCYADCTHLLVQSLIH